MVCDYVGLVGVLLLFPNTDLEDATEEFVIPVMDKRVRRQWKRRYSQLRLLLQIGLDQASRASSVCIRTEGVGKIKVTYIDFSEEHAPDEPAAKICFIFKV